MNDYKWPLASDNFTFIDRLKVAAFSLNRKNVLTMGPKVAEFERKMSEIYGCKALAVSSGSTANQLIFELWKQRNPEKFKNALVICPVVTWISSVSPALMAGYKIKFCDINLQDFSFDYKKLEAIIKRNKDKNIILWPTALIGRTPNFGILQGLAEKYDCELFGDFCEAQFSRYNGESIFKQVSLSSLSCYFSHMITSVEFGFVFFNDEKDYEFAKMLRNHGLTRSLTKNSPLRKGIESEYSNIDSQFLFANLGTNLRPTDCHAIWGLQDLKRIDKYRKHRQKIYEYYYRLSAESNSSKYYLPDYDYFGFDKAEHIAFCIPIFRKDGKISEVKKSLNENGIATRPIIGSCLTLQPPFRKYHNNSFKNGMWVHEAGCYVGLNYDLTLEDIDRLVKILNKV